MWSEVMPATVHGVGGGMDRRPGRCIVWAQTAAATHRRSTGPASAAGRAASTASWGSSPASPTCSSSWRLAAWAARWRERPRRPSPPSRRWTPSPSSTSTSTETAGAHARATGAPGRGGRGRRWGGLCRTLMLYDPPSLIASLMVSFGSFLGSGEAAFLKHDITVTPISHVAWLPQKASSRNMFSSGSLARICQPPGCSALAARCPLHNHTWEPSVCGCAMDADDSDGDGVPEHALAHASS